jgi:maltose O-acetyltransferase
MEIKSKIKQILYRITKKILFNYQIEENKTNLAKFKYCGSDVRIFDNCTIIGHEDISLGDNVTINSFVHIWGNGGLTIGDNSMIASHTAITTLTHNPNSKLFNKETIAKPIKIGNNVWIGTHSIILPGVTIGNNVIIGAGSFINKNIPDNSVYIGVPAKKLHNLNQFN